MQSRILSIYNGKEFTPHSINKIATLLGVSYPYVYESVKKLITENILISFNIGRSILCIPNLSNDIARNYLEQTNILSKKVLLKKPNLNNLNNELLNIFVESDIDSIIFNNEQLIFLVSNNNKISAILSKISFVKPIFLTRDLLKKEILSNKFTLNNMVIMFGHDRFLLLLNQIQREMLSINYLTTFSSNVNFSSKLKLGLEIESKSESKQKFKSKNKGKTYSKNEERGSSKNKGKYYSKNKKKNNFKNKLKDNFKNKTEDKSKDKNKKRARR